MNGLLSTIARLLTFRLSSEGYASLGKRELIAGLIGTWIAGMGRYWDNPKAEFLQKLGLGSVIYIFVLAALLWSVVLPLRVPDWRYQQVLTFISLTSFPAILYAIPVEMWVGVQNAISINALFLLIVAAWRVALLVDFLQKNTDLQGGGIATVVLLPLTAIVTALSLLNLEHAVFNIMGGFREQTGHEGAYTALLWITGISLMLFPLVFLVYIGSIWFRWKKRKQS